MRSIVQAKLASIYSVVLLTIPVIVLATAMYYQGLFQDKSLIQGDAILHGYPVLNYHAEVLQGNASIFWSNLIYGGHPVYAEAQFGFFSPLNNLVAYFLSPQLGQNVFHWLCLVLSGMGMNALCRRLAFGAYASIFAACVVTFSSMWLISQDNITISGALLWVPWVLLFFERWLQQPTAFIPLSLSMTFMFFAGYPQIVYGVAVYMLISLAGQIFCANSRGDLFKQMPNYFRYGIYSVLLCVGLAAVQLLPLLELVSQSYRGEGVTMHSYYYNIERIMRAFLYFPNHSNPQLQQFTFMGSALVCILASGVVFIKSSSRVVGHSIAAIIFLNLGMGAESPLYNLLADSHVLPGLSFFRISWPYFSLAIVGMAIMSAAVVQQLEKIDFSGAGIRVAFTAFVLTWGVVLVFLHQDIVSPIIHYILISAAAVGGLILFAARRKKLIAPLLLGLLICEIVFLKLPGFVFYDNSVLDRPGTANYLGAQDDIADYKLHDMSWSLNYAFTGRLDPQLREQIKKLLAALTPSSNLLWNIPAFGGAHALQQAQHVAIEPIIYNEILNKAPIDSGLRFVDVLGIRYVTGDSSNSNDSFKTVFEDAATDVAVLENAAALPRFQVYAVHQFVDDWKEAIDVMQALDDRVLIVERPSRSMAGERLPEVFSTNTESRISFTVQEERATLYRIRLDAPNAGWFFLADANYPGWQARIDGERTRVYSAQVLGKAVWIPEGEHQLVLEFVPGAFRYGLGVSLMTLMALLLYCGRRQYHTHRSATTGCENVTAQD